jgi:hypothetical protein
MSLILSGTDGLSDVDGSAATPAIRGTDANTGIFFGTDIIGFSEGGVEAMRIDANGNAIFTNAFSKVFSISASVASNALTISASALALDFRSATLGSGTVTTVSGAPANLVISSGSTLGTVSAVASRIVVLAINNAGTIELAAVNVSGGTQLDETNLISTTAEGGAGGADSATVVYSTTARTSVAYRVIGFIDSTQATAGTWATAPSTIQGVGGQALAALSSIGYGQTWQNVTSSRAIGTTYTNSTGRPIMVIVSGTGVGANGLWGVSLNSAISYYTPSTYTASVWTACEFIVPAGNTYQLSQQGSSVTLQNWSELR